MIPHASRLSLSFSVSPGRIFSSSAFNTIDRSGVMKRGRQAFSSRAPEPHDCLFELNVRDWISSRYSSNSSIHISEPREITFYSRDSSRKVHHGSRDELKLFRHPKIGSYLGDNFETFRDKAEDDNGVEPVVEALLKSNFDIDNEADFVTYRNNLNKIAGTPYNGRDAWELDSTMVNKSVYLDVRKLDEGPISPSHKQFMYYGYRFEALCTGTEQEPVDANAEFCSIIRLRLGNHRVLFAGEIDCKLESPDNEDSNALQSYVELKTMRQPRNERDYQNMYRHRFLKYWIQSYLAGVPRITIGMRDDEGILVDFKHYRTRSLPRLAAENLGHANRNGRGNSRGQHVWDPFVCLNFLDLVLGNIRKVCAKFPEKTMRVRYEPRTGALTGFIISSEDFGQRMCSLRKDSE